MYSDLNPAGNGHPKKVVKSKGIRTPKWPKTFQVKGFRMDCPDKLQTYPPINEPGNGKFPPFSTRKYHLQMVDFYVAMLDSWNIICNLIRQGGAPGIAGHDQGDGSFGVTVGK